MTRISMSACLAVLAVIAVLQGGVADAEVTITLESGQPVIVIRDPYFPEKDVVPVATRIAEGIWKKVCSEKAYKPCNVEPGYYEFHLDLMQTDGAFGCSSFIRGKKSGGESEYFETADMYCWPDETVIFEQYR